jgi:hypothetical protein
VQAPFIIAVLTEDFKISLLELNDEGKLLQVNEAISFVKTSITERFINKLKKAKFAQVILQKKSF